MTTFSSLNRDTPPLKSLANKPCLLFYCQHSLGMGHLIRSFRLIDALMQSFHVVLLNGGPMPEGVTIPRGITRIDLPPLGMTANHQLQSRSTAFTVKQAQQQRRELLLAALACWSPEVILIELFPFGRKKFAGELLPLLKATCRQQPSPPLILCSLRDLLVHSRKDQQRHDNRASWLVNRYFDVVLVHSDPQFAHLDESFQPSIRLRKPVYYTGFVLPPKTDKESTKRERRVLVSAGSGSVGGPLFRAALAAYDLLWASEQLPMTLVAGPFLPEPEWRDLQTAANPRPGLKLLRSVPDLGHAMRRVAVSVSQCGYNTAMDILHARTPALVVPFAEGREDEQLNRAQRLERLNIVRVLESSHLDGAGLAEQIRTLLTFQPSAARMNIEGAEHTAHIIRRLMIEAHTTQILHGICA